MIGTDGETVVGEPSLECMFGPMQPVRRNRLPLVPASVNRGNGAKEVTNASDGDLWICFHQLDVHGDDLERLSSITAHPFNYLWSHLFHWDFHNCVVITPITQHLSESDSHHLKSHANILFIVSIAGRTFFPHRLTCVNE